MCGDCSVDKNMIRSTGAAIAQGLLENVGSEQCLIPVADVHDAQVTTIECDDRDLNQQFTMYENGEIRHDVTGLCLGDNENKMGIFSVSFCTDKTTQGFEVIAQLDGSYSL